MNRETYDEIIGERQGRIPSLVDDLEFELVNSRRLVNELARRARDGEGDDIELENHYARRIADLRIALAALYVHHAR